MKNPCINCEKHWYTSSRCADHYMCDKFKEWEKQEYNINKNTFNNSNSPQRVRDYSFGNGIFGELYKF